MVVQRTRGGRTDQISVYQIKPSACKLLYYNTILHAASPRCKLPRASSFPRYQRAFLVYVRVSRTRRANPKRSHRAEQAGIVSRGDAFLPNTACAERLPFRQRRDFSG